MRRGARISRRAAVGAGERGGGKQQQGRPHEQHGHGEQGQGQKSTTSGRGRFGDSRGLLMRVRMSRCRVGSKSSKSRVAVAAHCNSFSKKSQNPKKLFQYFEF